MYNIFILSCETQGKIYILIDLLCCQHDGITIVLGHCRLWRQHIKALGAEPERAYSGVYACDFVIVSKSVWITDIDGLTLCRCLSYKLSLLWLGSGLSNTSSHAPPELKPVVEMWS